MVLDLRKVKVRQIGFRLQEEDYKEIARIAKREKVSTGEVIRAIIREWISKNYGLPTDTQK